MIRATMECNPHEQGTSMSLQLLAASAMLFTQVSQSPFNVYTALVDRRDLAPRCRVDDEAFFRNLTYPFHGKGYPRERSVKFRDGRFDERDDLGRIDWTTTLDRQEQIQLGNQGAVLLSFEADHVSGSGTNSHVFVVRCRDQRAEIVFEASGEAIHADYSNEWGLEIDVPFWKTEDSHADPSMEIREQYRWDESRLTFALTNRTERQRH